MNGAFGLERVRLLVDGPDREVAALEPFGQTTGERLVERPRTSSRLRRPLSSKSRPVATRRLSYRDERRREAGIGRERRLDVPIARGDEVHPLPLAFDDQPGCGALHAAGRQPCVDLPPQDRRHLVAEQTVEDPPCLLARRPGRSRCSRSAAHRFVDRGASDLVEDHPLDGDGWLERLEQVPRDRFALAVLVGREVELVRVLQRSPQLLAPLPCRASSPRRSALKPLLTSTARPLLGRSATWPTDALTSIVVAEEARDRLRLRGRLDDDEGSGHRR